ncbi:hypothetical protein EPA93_34610 [Ktedonosporobacter rubrisoli]|uniref:Uncharacterized protein n=1 Tax=Ktedonosporobacter rubrisoli TaxID=2509675 RepID=A0A4P6K0A6_KTERU|nr:hypothetical protein [Ktedonosporobacter rubrisoli]QBD80826.1 hypothetical protein EPA93_34610 [Ktedonosporobacter rubrisoli]
MPRGYLVSHDPEIRSYYLAGCSALTGDGRQPLEAPGFKLHERVPAIAASLTRQAPFSEPRVSEAEKICKSLAKTQRRDFSPGKLLSRNIWYTLLLLEGYSTETSADISLW